MNNNNNIENKICTTTTPQQQNIVITFGEDFSKVPLEWYKHDPSLIKCNDFVGRVWTTDWSSKYLDANRFAQFQYVHIGEDIYDYYAIFAQDDPLSKVTELACPGFGWVVLGSYVYYTDLSEFPFFVVGFYDSDPQGKLKITWRHNSQNSWKSISCCNERGEDRKKSYFKWKFCYGGTLDLQKCMLLGRFCPDKNITPQQILDIKEMDGNGGGGGGDSCGMVTFIGDPKACIYACRRMKQFQRILDRSDGNILAFCNNCQYHSRIHSGLDSRLHCYDCGKFVSQQERHHQINEMNYDLEFHWYRILIFLFFLLLSIFAVLY